MTSWLRSVSQHDLFVSVLVVGEIRRGVERLRVRDPAQATGFEEWLSELKLRFGNRIVGIDREVAEEWGRINSRRPVAVEDGLMAATARVRGMVFVTRNVADVATSAFRSSIHGNRGCPEP